MYHLEKKIESQGENITLNNTAKTPFEVFKVTGNSVQETREGYNLLNTPSELEITGYQRLSVDLKANNTYTLKFDDAIPSENNDSSLIRFMKNNDEDATDSQTVNTSINKKVIIATTENITQILIYSNLDYVSSQGKSKTFVNLMIYEGTEDKDYEPYGAMPSPEYPSEIHNVEGDVNVTVANKEKTEQQTVTFPLAEGQRLMLGDYLASDGIHHVRKQMELDGTEDWALALTNTDTLTFQIVNNNLPVKIPNDNDEIVMISNYFKGFSRNQFNNDKETESISPNISNGSKAIIITINKTTAENLNDFKSWLAAQKQAGTPVIVEYVLAEEEIEAYTEEQKTVYNQINSLYSYDEVTNIFSNNEISPIFDVSTFKMITEEFKERLLNGKITRAYLKVLATDTQSEFTIDENNYLKDLTFEELRYVPEEGFIGGTVAKRVTGNFNNIDNSFSIQDREFELYMGVDLEDETTEYIKYGTYIVQKPEDDQVNDNTSFEALDYMIKLNLPWVDRMTYPCTLKELFDDLVAQSGLSTKVTSFLNQDFIVENNQFEEGTTRRDVLKAIAQMAFNWARIDENNDIVMDFEKKDEVAETLTADNYYNFKKQDMYGPINVIVLRNSQVEGENITIRDEESIAQYGETELVISDNPFAYTQAKRAELIEAGRILFGLTYIPMSMDMIGYMYLNCKDKIKATNLNNETFETYLLNHTIEYAGTISDSMEAPASTKTETQYQFTPPMIEALKHTELLVDKANQRIDAVIKNISDTNEKMVEIEATLEGVTSTVSEVVKKTNETSEKVDNLKSGANNLIVNSGYFNNTDGWKANGDGITLSVENFDGFNCIKATGSIVYAYDELPLYNAGFIRLEPNSTYIIQLEMYLYRELAEGETDITYPITNSSPLHIYINSMKSTGVVMSGNNAIDSENGASVKKTLLSSSSYKTNEWVKIQLKIETGNPTLDYPYYAIKPFIWRNCCWNNRWKYSLHEKYLCKTNKYYF